MGNVIAKNRKAYGYDYADLGSVVNYVTETLKVKVQQSIQYDNLPQYPNGYGFVVTRYWKDDSKSWSAFEAPVPIIVGDSAGKREQPFMQRYGSAETYARRYSLLTLFCLATSDDDGQLAGYQRGNPMNEELRKQVAALLAQGNVPAGRESEAIGNRIKMPVNYARLTDWQAQLFINSFKKNEEVKETK
nr:MAG TPA: ERF superfamily protein [Caudoviricetes sp.]